MSSCMCWPILEQLVPGIVGQRTTARSWPLRSATYAAFAAGTLLFMPQSIQPFIYVQF